MNGLMTITKVTKAFGISTRTLRYYEQIGLLESKRAEGYSYRVYDDAACARLRQIIILRKLRVPLKQISMLLQDSNAVVAIELFVRNIEELDEEIASLSTIRDILRGLVDKLRENVGIRLSADLLSDLGLLTVIAPISLNKFTLKEEKTMDDLNKADAKLSRLTDKDVRIIYLPPMDVATYRYFGDDPEMHVHQVINKFVLESDLPHIKPDLRHYGFNSPNPDETGLHGYEIWVTIPEGMNVPEPLVKKRFEGGLYGAHMIPFGAFEEWGWLFEWVQNSDKYEYRGSWSQKNQFDCLEEALNYVNRVNLPDPESDGFQLDLLIPVREKQVDNE